MDAILLAGGFGTRLRPLTYTRPKPLLPVAGRPMVEWVLDRLPKEVDRVLLTVNWKAEALAAYFERSERDLEFVVVPEPEPLGTAGAVKNCEPVIQSEDFFVLNADIVSTMDLAAQLRLHHEKDATATISLKEVEPAEVVHYGVAAMDPEDPTRVQGFVEKPARVEDAPSRLINAGAYLLHRSILGRIPSGQLVSMEKTIFPQLIADDEPFHGLAFTGDWIDVGDPERLRAASRTLDPDTWHGPGAELDPGCVVEDSVAGVEVTVESGAVVQRSVLGDRVTIRQGTRVIDCVVGDGEAVTGDHKGRRIWTRDVPDGYPEKQVGNVLSGQ